MKRSKIGAGLLTAGLMAGGCSIEAAIPVPNDPETQSSFDAIQKYWADKGAGDADKTKLVTIKSGSINCTNRKGETKGVSATSTGVAYFCDENMIVISRSFQRVKEKAAAKGVNPANTGALIVAHEYGHQSG
jgi:hypothetical protein